MYLLAVTFYTVLVMYFNEDNYYRIYVDVVFNHMTGDYTNAYGVRGTPADTYNKYYPGVPYGPEHFNHTCAITNYQDPVNVSNNEL